MSDKKHKKDTEDPKSRTWIEEIEVKRNGDDDDDR